MKKSFMSLFSQTVLAVGLFVGFFGIQLAASYFYIRKASYNELSTSLDTFVKRVDHDLTYTGSSWNLSKYNADPAMPYPNTPNPFPLYVITVDGYVVQRSRPIKGLLDASDFKHLLTFSLVPQTITSPTSENWRVSSRRIMHGGQTVGVVGVAYYHPESALLGQIDDKLAVSLDTIQSMIDYRNGAIDLSRFDTRNVPYDVTFEIVDRFNRIMLNNGRTPSYIDPSYVSSALARSEFAVVKDASSHEPFLVRTYIVHDKNNAPLGIVVAGKSTAPIESILFAYVRSTLVVYSILLIPFILIVMYFWRRGRSKEKIDQVSRSSVIRFDREHSAILVDGTVKEIPYASNQFYLCAALFSDPKKRWEYDEILEWFGEQVESTNVRKIYDAMLAVNKKIGIKLIMYKDKTFRVNPDFAGQASVLN